MKTTLICPVYNEEGNLKKTFESVNLQSEKIEEIIFIEDSSTDNTYNELKEFKRKNKKVKIIRVKNKNISKNRNEAIKNSSGEIIICLDAGCELSYNYIENILKPFEDKNVYFVGGISKIKAKNLFDKCFSEFIEKNKISKDYLPKGHAMAFRKELWEKVGGFPEKLALGAEDTYFGKKAVSLGYKPFIVKDAIVYWENRKNLREIFKQFKNYGYWDSKAFSLKNLPRKSKLNVLISIIFPLALLHTFYKGMKLGIKFRNFRAFYYGFMIDLTKIYGYFFGLIGGKNK